MAATPMTALPLAPASPTAWQRLRDHLPEYLIEAWALGSFMLSAGLWTTVVEHPGSPLHAALGDPLTRRAAIGLAMGVTAVLLIRSPWGRRSGAHMNPAVTLSYLRLGRIAGLDAAGFIAAQFAGGLAGVLACAALFGAAFTAPPVAWAATEPGFAGPAVAFVAEMAISAVTMAVVLVCSSSPRFASHTPLAAGALVASYITLEAPLSGMSMNPARTFASAAPQAAWDHLWIYLVAPPLGMLLAAEGFGRLRGRRAAGCAKLLHAADQRCIHCGHQPSSTSAGARSAAMGGEDVP